MLANNRITPYDKHLKSLRLIGLSVFLVVLTLAPTYASTTNEAQVLVTDAEILRARWTESDLREALQKYDKATLIWTSLSQLSKASLTALQAGDACFLLSEFAEAFKRYKTAARLAEKNRDRLAQGRALSKMGRVYSYQGHNDLARSQVHRALVLLKITLNDPDLTAKSAYGEALTNMAEISYAFGNLAKALEQFDEASRFLDHDREGQARIHLFKANTAGSLGNVERALWECDRALELYQAVNNKTGEGLTRIPRALYYSFRRPADETIPILRDVIFIFKSIGDRHSEALALNALGQVHERLENRPVALNYYEEGLRLLESVGAWDHVAVMTFKLATMYVDDNPEKAFAYYDHCLTLSRAAGKVRNEANALSEIALVYASQKRPDRAAQQHSTAQKFYEKIGDHRGQAVALNRYGNYLFLKLKQPREALDVYRRALPLSEQVGDSEILLETLYNFARAQHHLGDHMAALSVIEQSLRMIEDLRAGVGTPDLRTLYFSGVRQHYELCINILMQLERARPGEGFGRRAFLMSEKSRARSLIDLVRESRSTLREDAAADLLRRERETIALITLMSEYQWSLSLGREKDPAEESEVASRMAKLNDQYYEIQTKLRAQNHFRPAIPEFELMDLEQVQRALPPDGTMLLEYSLGDERSYLWAITSDSFRKFELPRRKDLEDAAVEAYKLLTARQRIDVNSDYQTNVEEADRQYFEKATSLSRMLLGPVADQLGNRRLIVVSEGAIQLIPFDALPVPRLENVGPLESAKPTFLIYTNEIVALPSMSTLLAMRAAVSRPAAPGRVVAIIADPVFSSIDNRVKAGSPMTAHAASSSNSQQQPGKGSVPSVSVPRLVYSSEEADAISAVAPYGSTLVAKGFDASRETAMSPLLGEYQIVHFATHGFADADHPELSSIVLTMVDRNGVNKNGLMSLYDIYNLDLAAELTVLSACQTALGKDIRGEGLVGLTHSFMSAGSRSVVASLWKVDDRATAKLMSHFYESVLQEELPPSASLRSAKLKMLQDERLSAPYYWAGFVFQGDYESRIKLDSNNHLLFGLMLLLLVLISSGLIVFVRLRRRPSPAAERK